MPTPTSYTYATAAFKNARFDLASLEADIFNNASITVACSGSSADRSGNVTLTFKDVLDTASKTALDGDAGAAANATPTAGSTIYEHEGDPLQQENLDADGNLVVAPTFLHSTNAARLHGYRLSIAAGQQAIQDVEVTTQLLVQGGQFWITGAGPDDTAYFSVVDKDGVIPYPANPSISLMQAYGLTPGADVLEITRYISDLPIPEVAYYQDKIVLPTVASVLPGLYLRVSYDNTGTNAVKMGLTYHWYEG